MIMSESPFQEEEEMLQGEAFVQSTHPSSFQTFEERESQRTRLQSGTEALAVWKSRISPQAFAQA